MFQNVYYMMYYTYYYIIRFVITKTIVYLKKKTNILSINVIHILFNLKVNILLYIQICIEWTPIILTIIV